MGKEAQREGGEDGGQNDCLIDEFGMAKARVYKALEIQIRRLGALIQAEASNSRERRMSCAVKAHTWWTPA